MKAAWSMSLAAALALMPLLVQAQAVISERSIYPLNAALEAATASLQRCRADGYQVSVTVLNRHRARQWCLATIAPIRTRSRTACARPIQRLPDAQSVELGKRSQSALAGFLVLDKMTTLEGGLPIFAGKELIGSIGVSGSPGGDKDAVCAQVGIDKVAKGFGD